MYKPPSQNSIPNFHNAVNTQSEPSIWPQVYKGLLMAGTMLTAFIPGWDEVVPQLLISEAYAGGIFGINNHYGITNGLVNPLINFLAPTIGLGWGFYANYQGLKILEDSVLAKNNNLLLDRLQNYGYKVTSPIGTTAFEKELTAKLKLEIFNENLFADLFSGRSTGLMIEPYVEKTSIWINPIKKVNEALTRESKLDIEKLLRRDGNLPVERFAIFKNVETELKMITAGKINAFDEIRKDAEDNTSTQKQEDLVADMLNFEDREKFSDLLWILMEKGYTNEVFEEIINSVLLPMMGEAGTNINSMRYEFFRILKETKAANEMSKLGENMSKADIFHATVAKFRKEYSVFWKQARKNIAYEQRSGWKKIRDVFSHKNLRKTSNLSRALNPSNLGRMPVNILYRQLRKFTKKFGEKLLENIGKDKEDAIKGAGSLGRIMKETIGKAVDRFMRTGTIELNSAWLSELKLISKGIGEHLVMVTFKPEVTKTKAPVFRWMNDFQIEKMITQPGTTYDNIFAASRGGRSVSVMELFGRFPGQTKQMSKMEQKVIGHILAFLPVQTIRSILSIASNMKKFTMRTHQGTEFKDFWGKVKKSSINTAISRATRFISRGIVGDLVGERLANKVSNKKLKFLIHHALGMEVQRVMTYSLNVKLKDIYAGKHNKHFWGAMEGKILYGMTRTVRDQSNAFIRHQNPYSNAAANVAVRRKLRIVKRAYPLVRNWKNPTPKKKTARVHKPRIKKHY